MPTLLDLPGISQDCEDYRESLDVMRRAKPMITFYRNKVNEDPDFDPIRALPGFERSYLVAHF